MLLRQIGRARKAARNDTCEVRLPYALTAFALWAALALITSTATVRGEDCNGNGIDDVCDVDCGPVGGPCDVTDCGLDQDVDADGVMDACDVCRQTPPGVAVDVEGRPLGDVDRDCDTDVHDYGVLQRGFTGSLLPHRADMAFVPGGLFEMGCHVETCHANELPAHTVYVNSFHIDTHQVTNRAYCDYLNAAYRSRSIDVVDGIVYRAGASEPYCDTYAADGDSRIHWGGCMFTVTPQKEDHPMVEVSWYGAAAYANWRSIEHRRRPCYDLSTWACDVSADGYHLPTEAEWERGARGGAHDPYTRYPWGDEMGTSHANFRYSGDPFESADGPQTTPVAYYDGSQTPPGADMANGYGMYDVAGNVWEWCHDWYDSAYYDSSPDDNPAGPADGVRRTLRGGSWRNSTVPLRSASRFWATPSYRGDIIGFRLAAGM